MRNKSTIVSDLAKTLKRSEENQIYFFSQSERFDLFVPLKKEGFFAASSVPEPIESSEGQLFTRWPPEGYLEKVAKHIHLTKGADSNLSLEFLDTIRQLSPKKNFLLASTLFRCFCHIPPHLLVLADISLMFEWLRDSGGTDTIIETTLVKGLADFIEDIDDSPHNRELLALFVRYAFEPADPKKDGPSDLRFIAQHGHRRLLAEHFNVSQMATSRAWILQIVVDTLEPILVSELNEDDRDARSVIWRPAVEDHKQNEFRDTAMSLLIGIIFNLTSELLVAGHFVSKISSWEVSELWGLRRIYFALAAKFPKKIDPESAARVFITIGPSSFFRHEAFSFLKNQFEAVSEITQNKIIEVINSKIDEDLDESDPRILAWEKIRWVVAFKNSSNELARENYADLIAITEHEPEHPDFSTYSSGVVWVGNKSPYTPAEIAQMTTDELIQELKTFSLTDDFRGPTIDGFGNALEQHISESPIRIIELSQFFAELRPEYVSSVLDGAIKALASKKPIQMLDLISGIEKWAAKSDVILNIKDGARESWAVSSFARLVEEGTKEGNLNWDNTTIEELHKILRKLLLVVPEREGFNVNSDAFTRAINDPRGRIYESLISLALLQSRTTADEGRRLRSWNALREILDAAITTSAELSLRALLGAHYRQIQYLGGDWMYVNLANIIQRDKGVEKWLSFMDGFSYVAYFDKRIYLELRDAGDLLRYLRFGNDNDSSRRDRLQNRVVELSAIAFLLGVEDINDGILAEILSNDNIDEWHAMIWALPSVIGKDPSPELLLKANILINRIFDVAQSREKLAKGKYLAGLWRLLVYFTNPDAPIVERILTHSAKAAEGGWDFFGDLEYLHRYRHSHTARVGYLFKKIIDSSLFIPSYPDEQIRDIGEALFAGGQNEILAEICVRYAEDAPNGGPIRDICNKL